MEGDTAEWRQRMLSEYGLTTDNIAAWFRGEYTPAQIEEHMSGVGKANNGVPKEVDRNDAHNLITDAEGIYNLNLEVEVAMATDDVAAVQLDVHFNGKQWAVEGSSKRAPGDQPDRELGVSLAFTRALQNLAKQFERQVNGRIKQNDWIAAQRPLVTQARRERGLKAVEKGAYRQALAKRLRTLDLTESPDETTVTLSGGMVADDFGDLLVLLKEHGYEVHPMHRHEVPETATPS